MSRVWVDLLDSCTEAAAYHRIIVCKNHRLIAIDDAAFLSRVTTDDESWFYGYNPKTKQQSSQWKMKSNVKSMLIILFLIKVIVPKEVVLACQTVNSAYYCDVLRRLREYV
jgi:hypothetical protein